MVSGSTRLAAPEQHRGFEKDVERGLKGLVDLDDLDVVVGIPFHDEDDTLGGVVDVARRGLADAGYGERSAVVCVGTHAGGSALRKALDGASDPGPPVRGFLLGRGIEGRGWCVRALMKIAATRGAVAVVLTPDLDGNGGGGEDGSGYGPGWFPRLIAAVEAGGADLALARFNRHPLASSVESLLARPLIETVFGVRIAQPIPGVFAASSRLISSCLPAAARWSLESGTFGFDAWLVTRAIVEGATICEVPLGSASFRHGIGKLKLMFRQCAQVLMEQTAEHAQWWKKLPPVVAAPVVSGFDPDFCAAPYEVDAQELKRVLRDEFGHLAQSRLVETLPEGVLKRIMAAVEGAPGHENAAADWSEAVSSMMTTFAFDSTFHRDDVVDGLYPHFVARLLARIDELSQLRAAIGSGEDGRPFVRHELEHRAVLESSRFMGGPAAFRAAWDRKERDSGSYLPRVVSWELVPNVEVVIPQEVARPGGGSAWGHEVYQELIARYRGQYAEHVAGVLGLDEDASSGQVLEALLASHKRLDSMMAERWLQGDLSVFEDVRECTDRVCGAFSRGSSFQLTGEAITGIFEMHPPRNLMTTLGADDLKALFEMVSPNDAMGMAAMTDRRSYLQHVLDVIEREGEPGWFREAPLRPVVVDSGTLPHTDDARATAALARLAGRLVVRTRVKGWGGELPRLWFALQLIKRIVGVELFGDVWAHLANGGGDFGARVAATVRGHWGRRVLSVHNAFENRHQRILVERLLAFAADLAQRDPSQRELAEALRETAAVYHLSITLPDATFVPLSAWTWASYSARGGVGAPTPLSSLVERDWSSFDFLAAYLDRAGLGDERTLGDEVWRLVLEGREQDDLGELLLGVGDDQERLFVKQSPMEPTTPAGRLIRPVTGPILEPVQSHRWESRYVLNAAAVRLEGTVYILYRAYGDEDISRIGLAWTRDGVTIDGRLDEPVFYPANASESAGCEDPRVTVIGERMYMLYTAWDRVVPQIALASIPVRDFLDRRWDRWHRHGLGFPGLSNKDAVLYPRKFDGKYVLYHRIDPNMWVSYLDDLECPWPRTGHKVVIGPRPGMMWDGLKIGAGAQPIETTAGWLNIYHGVDYERSYRLGVLFTDLEDPSKVLYQSPNPILEPAVDFEVGKGAGGDFWVPNVVFTCGAVPAQDKEVIGPDDEVLVYYGAADTAIGVAKGRLKDLVPILD